MLTANSTFSFSSEALEAENERLRQGIQAREPQPSTAPTVDVQQPTPATSQLTTNSHHHPIIANPNSGTAPSENVFQATYSRTSKIIERKPPLDLVIAAVSVFLRHIHPWFPIVDVQRILSELVTTREPSLLLNATFGASLPFLHDCRLDQASSDPFWKYTKRKIFAETAEEPSYASLEACTILTLDLSGMTNGPQVWSRLAVIVKLASQLRTPRGQALRPSVQMNDASIVAKPGSRQHARLFWAIFALESFVTITTGQPSQLTETFLRPFRESRKATWQDGSDPTSPVSLFLHQLELLDISRDIHAAYLEYISASGSDDAVQHQSPDRLTELSHAPSVWLAGLPANLRMNESLETPPPPLLVMVHAYSHSLTIFASGLIEFSGVQSLHLPARSNSNSVEDMHSVHAIADLCTKHVDAIGDQLGWPFAWSLWTAARYLLIAAHNHSVSPHPCFHTLLGGIGKMGRYWQVSKKYWRLLSRAEKALALQQSAGNGASSDDEGAALGEQLLAAMVNLRIPTSDLEDRFRVDPLLCQNDSHAESSSSMASETGDGATAPIINGPDVYGHDAGMLVPDSYLGDTWFTSPLFASSAYQVFPGDMGGLHTEEGWGL